MAEEVLRGLLFPGQWHVTTPDGKPKHLQRHCLQNYLTTTRGDVYRLEQLHPPDHRPGSQKQYNLIKTSLSSTASTLRILWDKGWHGGNATKKGGNEQAYQKHIQCPLCDQPDSQQHWLSECLHPDLDELRNCNDRLILQTIKQLLHIQPDGTSIWTGMWTEDYNNNNPNSYPPHHDTIKMPTDPTHNSPTWLYPRHRDNRILERQATNHPKAPP